MLLFYFSFRGFLLGDQQPLTVTGPLLNAKIMADQMEVANMSIIQTPEIILLPEKKIEMLYPTQATNGIILLDYAWSAETVAAGAAASATGNQLATVFDLQ